MCIQRDIITKNKNDYIRRDYILCILRDETTVTNNDNNINNNNRKLGDVIVMWFIPGIHQR